jgi:hypothetical protein
MMTVPAAENTDRRLSELGAREAMRELRLAIDRYHDLALERGLKIDDTASYPPNLSALEEARLLRRVPVDPLTGASNWIVISTSDRLKARRGFVSDGRNVFDVRTRAEGRTLDGVDYGDL